jgi:NTP pyrophosphatase (non-canonical NTP hydrolase)
MDNDTSINVLKEMVKSFCEDRGWDPYHNPKELSIGVITEASELLEIFRFQTTENCESMMKSPSTREAIADEISDVLYFLLRFAQKYDFDISSEFKRKMEKNKQKYPKTIST